MSLDKEFFNRETNIKATIICDSISESGKRITTLEIEYPRFILAELNTHKMLEKNSSSSRAIPIKDMIAQIENNLATPIYWGKSKSGMQADLELDINNRQYAKDAWDIAKGEAIDSAQRLYDYGLHKQTANRLLEPFQMMKTVITGTEWDNFFNLRIHPDAQPEFCMLAYKMYIVMQESKPNLLRDGDWHLPYINVGWNSKGDIGYFDSDFNMITLEQAQRISASCCAQTSYRKSDDSLEKADKVFDKLIHADVLHSSPFGHLATPVKSYQQNTKPYLSDLNGNEPDTWQKGVTHMNKQGELCSGNLNGWVSYRHLIPNNTCYSFNFEERMEMFK